MVRSQGRLAVDGRDHRFGGTGEADAGQPFQGQGTGQQRWVVRRHGGFFLQAGRIALADVEPGQQERHPDHGGPGIG
jgi:hypothetical protein